MVHSSIYNRSCTEHLYDCRSSGGGLPLKSYYYRLIWLGCLSVCLPLVLAGIAYYHHAVNREMTYLQNRNLISLGIIQQYVDDTMLRTVQELSRLALDPVTYESLSELKGFAEIDNRMEMIRKITDFQARNEYVGEVYYVNFRSGLILSSNQANVPEEYFRYRDDLPVIREGSKTGKWVYLPAAGENGHITFSMTLPAMSVRPQGILVVQLETEKINRYLSTFLTMTRNQTIFVMNSDYEILFQSSGRSDVDQLVRDAIMKERDSGNLKTNHSLVKDGRGIVYSYTYQKSSSGVTYVSMIPQYEIAKDLRWILWTTLLAVIVLLSIGIVLTIYSLRRAYHPIGQLVDYGKRLCNNRIPSPREEIAFIRECLDYFNNETKTLSEWIARTEPSLVERFLQQLLEGSYINNDSINKDCKKYGVPVNHMYAVMLVRVENYGRRFQSKDKPILTYAITNVMNELLANHIAPGGYILSNHRGEGVAVLTFRRSISPHEAETEMRRYAKNVQEALLQYLNVRVSVGIGRIYSHIMDVRLSYRESELALQYRLFHESESVLSIDDVDSHKKAPLVYPKEMETSVIEALSCGNMEQAREALEIFAQRLKGSRSYSFIYQGYHLLLASIISSLGTKCGQTLQILEYDLFEQLKSCRTSGEICKWFTDTVFPLYRTMIEEKDVTAGKAVVKEVIRYIMENVGKDISLTECADRFHINPSYLSRVFKKETGMSFLDYVTDCKVNEAKRLLVNTDRHINQIAEAVGYSHRTFNRIFRRFVHMSPSHYRAIHRS